MNSGLVVMGDDLFLEAMGSNPRAIYRMDTAFFTLNCCNNCIVCLKRLKINKKRPGLADLKKFSFKVKQLLV